MSKYRFSRHNRARWRLVTRLCARDGDACSICGAPMDRRLREPEDPLYITFDHILPRSAGGLDAFVNLRLAHRSCNEARGNDPLQEDQAA